MPLPYAEHSTFLIIPWLLFMHTTMAGFGGSVGCAVRLETRRLLVQLPPRSATFFRDHEIFSTVILSFPLIQEGQLSVSGERMCTILVNHLKDYACPVNVWLGKLTALNMTPLGWLGHKTSTQMHTTIFILGHKFIQMLNQNDNKRLWMGSKMVNLSFIYCVMSHVTRMALWTCIKSIVQCICSAS